MREVRDFGKVADFLLPQSFKLHTAILFISILMIPGVSQPQWAQTVVPSVK